MSAPREPLRLPAVPAERLDAVLRAAGSSPLLALAVLISAIGWILARTTDGRVRPVVLAGVNLGLVRAIRVHGPAEGQG